MVVETVQSALALAASKVAGEAVQVSLQHPKEESHGDYATSIALQLARRLSRPPLQIAQDIVTEFEKHQTEFGHLVQKIEAVAPGFINLTLSENVLFEELAQIAQTQNEYGSSQQKAGLTWSIEHTSPNPNKAMHLGHLRNNVTALAIANLWESQGIKVIRDCVDNNRGIAIAKLMWGYLKFARTADQPVDLNYWFDHQDEWQTPESLGVRPDRFVDELYVKASEDVKDPEIEKTVRQLVVDWENHDTKNWALWERVLAYSHAGQDMTLSRLGNHYDTVWHEHEHYQKGKDLVEKGLQTGVFRKAENGVILTNLESYGLSDTVVQKSDGTSLYITQDLALTKLKKETFRADRLHWVIGPEQSLAMQQVFAVCDQLGIGKRDEFVHIAFGYMSIKGQGKMSSRAGNVVYIDDLIDQAKTEILERMQPDAYASEQERQDIAEKIAVGAVKYSILHVGRLTNTAFDFATSLSLDGDSGPYLQYTYARCRSVERKAQEAHISVPSQIVASELAPEERAVVRWLYRFPEVVTEASTQMAPNLVASFLLELAQRYNAFYGQHQIMNASERERAFRLQLTRATAQVLHNGLKLLGIQTVERM